MKKSLDTSYIKGISKNKKTPPFRVKSYPNPAFPGENGPFLGNLGYFQAWKDGELR